MAQRSLKIIVVLFVYFWPVFLLAQKPFQPPKTMQQVIGKLNYEQQQWTYRSAPLFIRKELFDVGEINHLQPNVFLRNNPNPVFGPLYSFHLNPGYYSQSIGFFCRKELQMQKITSVPLRFRLGSLDYVNWLEQKPNAVKPR
jgi:hypothetical protein